MAPDRPHRVVLTHHAFERALRHGRTVEDVADLVLVHHPDPRRNAGSARWKVVAKGTVVVYDWPHYNDSSTARVVTVWPID